VAFGAERVLSLKNSGASWAAPLAPGWTTQMAPKPQPHIQKRTPVRDNTGEMEMLHQGISEQSLRTVEKVASRVDLRRARTRNPLHAAPMVHAAEAGSKAIVRFLATQCDLEQRDVYPGNTALLAAAEAERPKIVETLLELGADPLAVNHMGDTSLMLSLTLGSDESLRCFELLLPVSDAGAADRDGQTALMVAAHYHGFSTFEKLLPLSDPAAVSKHGETAAWGAIYAGGQPETHAIAKLDALFSLIPADSSFWLRVKSEKHTSLAQAAIDIRHSACAHWLLDRKIGSPACANDALGECFKFYSPSFEETQVARRLLRLADAKRPQSSGLLLLDHLWSLASVFEPGAVYARDFELDSEMVDFLAAADPLNPCARDIWEAWGPQRLPRLNAAVEAEILRQTLARSNPAALAATENDAFSETSGGRPARGAARRV